jgi:magnesium transporter
MLRSLVSPVPNGEDGEFVLRRNLTRESLEAAFAARDVMWLDVVDATDDEIRWLEKLLSLHPAVVSDLRRDDRRPTLMIYPEYLFLSLFQPSLKVNQLTSEEVHCLVGDHFFVTVRKESTNTVASAYDRMAQSTEYWRRGATYFLYTTIQFVVDAYYPLLDRISNQLNQLEESVLLNGGKTAQQAVYRIKQQLIHLRQMVAPQREVVSSVIGEARLSRSNEDRDLFRHLYERLLRVYDVIDSQRDLASNVLDLMESQSSTKMANAVSRLTILSMIFLPLTFIVGLFGINFITTQPELVIQLPGVTVLIFILMLTFLSAFGLAWFFRRQGWL